MFIGTDKDDSLDEMIKVRIYGRLSSLTDSSEIEIPSNGIRTVRDLLERIRERGGERLYKAIVDEKADDIRVGVILVVNGKSITLMNGLDSELKDQDDVYIDTIGFIPLEGGG
jgi:molybdopterin converting factor small subunit